MPQNRNSDRANLGEQSDMSSTDIERQDRPMRGGAHGDGNAGSEGIEDPALERSHRKSMDSSSSDRSGRASSRDMARATKRTRGSRDESNTEDSESENPMV